MTQRYILSAGQRLHRRLRVALDIELALNRWSELLNEEKPFTDDEKAFFDKQAQHAYCSFRDKVRDCTVNSDRTCFDSAAYKVEDGTYLHKPTREGVHPACRVKSFALLTTCEIISSVLIEIAK